MSTPVASSLAPVGAVAPGLTVPDVRGLAGIGEGMRQGDREALRDAHLLAWIARFGFVTVTVLAWRWHVSEQRMRARLRRLEAQGKLTRARRLTNEPARVAVTEAGGADIGLLVRTRRRGGTRLGHELAIAKRVMAIETHFAAHGLAGRVLTERDMRRAQRSGERRYAVAVRDLHGRRRQRWADYVVHTPQGATAVELEFTGKTSARLDSIVSGYLRSDRYQFVDFVLLEGPEHRALWRRLGAVVEAQTALERAQRLDAGGMPVLRLVAWRDPLPQLHAGIEPFPGLPDPPATEQGQRSR